MPLAERTTASTQEISEIVGGVRHTTDEALETMSHAKNMAEDVVYLCEAHDIRHADAIKGK